MEKERWLSLIQKISRVAILTLVGLIGMLLMMGTFQYRYQREQLMATFSENTELIKSKLDEAIVRSRHEQNATSSEKHNTQEYEKLRDQLKALMLLGTIKYVYLAEQNKEGEYAYLVDYGNAYVTETKKQGAPIEAAIIPYLERAFLGESFLSEKVMKTDRGDVVTSFIPIVDNSLGVQYVLGVEFDMQATMMQIKHTKKAAVLSGIMIELFVTFLSFVIYYHSIKNDNQKLEKSVYEAVSSENLLIQIASLQSSGIIAYTLPKRKILMFNKEALRIYDLKDEEEVSKIKFDRGAVTTVLEEDRERLQKHIKKLKNVGDVIHYRYRLQHKDGKILTILAYSKLAEATEGEMIVISSLLDITQQAKLQSELQFERRQYRDAMIKNSEFAFFVDLTSGMVTKDNILQAHIKKGNDIMQQLPMPYDQFTALWKKSMQPIFENSEVDYIIVGEYLIEKYREGKTKIETDCYSITQEAYYRMVVLLSENEENHHVYACIMVMDITDLRIEERKAKIALEEACKAANRANNAKSEFLSRMSHDIRTPLNGIMGMLEMADKYINDPEKLRYCHRKIHIASDYLLEIVNDVLDMSRLERGKVKFVDEPFDFRQLLEDCMEILLPLAEEKKVKIRSDQVNCVQHPYIISSCLHIRQIIMNIVSNAIKYNKPGGSVEVKVEEELLTDDRVRYFIYICDTGIGMDESFQAKMFEPFVQENEKQCTNYMGTGLGLAIVKEILQKLGGTIKVHSKKNVGSTFILSIPFKLAQLEQLSCKSKAKDKTQSLKGKRVLLVEDNDLNAEIAQFMLEENEIEVQRAENGQKAVELFDQSKEGYFDLILMDIMMPVMDGLTATKSIHALNRTDAKRIPIIAMTANAYESDKKASIEVGMCAHLSKPLKQEKLIEVIKQFIEIQK